MYRSHIDNITFINIQKKYEGKMWLKNEKM
jgi:hypothetical protein